MVLITCPDCGRKVSDQAPHCIHCGRPAESSIAKGAGALAKRAKEVASEAAGSTRAAMASWSTKLSGGVSSAVRDLSAAAAEKIFEDREVVAFLLPTGAGPGDFVSYLDLSEALELLSQGRLVRPRLTVWAHRSDVDKDRLAIELEQKFSHEVAAFRSRKLREHEVAVRQSFPVPKAKPKDADKKRGKPAKPVKIGAGGILAMALLSSSLLHLVLLVIAVTAATDVAVELIRKAAEEADQRRALREGQARTRALREEVQQKQAALRKEAQQKQAAFRKALDSIELRIHHQLAVLASDYAQLDDEPFVPEPVEQGPDLILLLRDSTYQGALAAWYYPLLDSRMESWTRS